MLKISVGSIVTGKSGTPFRVVTVEREKVLVKYGDELLRVDRKAILQVLSPPPEPAPEPTSIEIGSRLRRNSRPKTNYPAKWFPNGVDPRTPWIDSIESATVEGVSPDGYWVTTGDGKTYHAPFMAIESGDWELVEPDRKGRMEKIL